MNSIRKEYETYGVENFYHNYGNEYVNPKENIVNSLVKEALQKWDIGKDILDMCCGSGEVTKAIMQYNSNYYNVMGMDPFTNELYVKNMKKECIKMNFDDIVSGKLSFSFTFDTIFCSFALHLCEESKLPQLLWQLSLICKNLIIITPHKRPNCNGMSFQVLDEIKLDRCTMKLYHSKNYINNF